MVLCPVKGLEDIMKLTTSILGLMMVLSVISVFGAINVDAEYSSHAPIRIDSNSDFGFSHGVTGGYGTAIDPWIINNLEINGTGYGYCLYIGNTTDYFVVQDCYFHEASGNSDNYFWNSGLILYNVNNGKVKDCVSKDNAGNGGFLLKDSNDNVIEHNFGTENQRALYLYNSDANTILYNNFSSNSIAGVYLYSSDDNVVNNSIVSYNDVHGVWLVSSDRNTINDNYVESNSQSGLYFLKSDHNTIKNNTVDSNAYGSYLFISCNSNDIYHNNFLDNTNQAYDKSGNSNSWDNGYPSGGNYWDDYTGVDNNSGPEQDQLGSDGIGDTPYSFNYSVDNYPLMEIVETEGLGVRDDPEGLGVRDDPE